MKLKYSLTFLILFLISGLISAQSDNCSSATTLTPGSSCTPTSGTTSGATPSITGCVGNADDDVWYKFVATATSHEITVAPSASMDVVVQLFSGACSTLTTLACQDAGLMGQSENILATGLTIGTTYTIRLYDYYAGSGSGNFTICVSNPPPAPSNNTCAGATALSVNSSCTTTSGTSVGATLSQAGCTGTADDDVWYTFVATNALQTITVDPSNNMDAVVEMFSGSCGSLTSLYCMDNGLTNGNEVISAIGLTPGATYYIRVYDYYAGNGGYPFTICITGAPTAVPTNDEPCNAIALPTVTPACNYANFTTVGATASMGAPTPFSCYGGSGAAIGGFSASTKDVWFSVVVPSTGQITATIEPWMSAGSITDGVMAFYSGTCGALTQIKCGDKYTSNPGTVNDELPVLRDSLLTPGQTIWIRYWGFGSSQGSFAICVTTTANDACANAVYICDINGYGGTTSSAYTPDHPSNMRGDNEDLATSTPPYNNLTDGTSVASGGYPAGIFGLGGTWGTGEPAIKPYDVVIDNNSWVRFTAANTTAVLNVTVSYCWKDAATYGTNRGIQMQIFSGTNCTNFAPVSDYRESATGFTLTANNLVVGQDYYLMIDGFSGDVCNYTIGANTGVQFPAITSSGNPICVGAATTLTAPAGATSYEWFPTGETTQVITANPSTTTTYTCVVGGVCGYKQTLTKTITVNPLPVVAINANNPTYVCNGSAVTLSASGANTYLWNTGATGSSISVSPTTITSYTVTGTDANGCKNNDTVNVVVKSVPPVTVNSPSVCYNSSATLNAGGANTYSWSSGGSGASVTVGPLTNSSYTYTVTGTAVNSCTATATSTVTVLTRPTISVNDPTMCAGIGVTLTASGASSSTNYTWSNGTNNTNTISVNPASTVSYTVTGTAANGCTNTDVATVTVNNLPTVSSNNPTICAGKSTTLTPTGALTYTWNGTAGAAISVSPTTTTTYTLAGTDNNNCSNTYTATVTVNQLPQVTTAATVTSSACGLSTGAINGVTVSGTPTLSYSWTNGSNVQVATTLNVSNIPAGPYNLTITDGNTCTNTYSVSVSNPGAPSAPSVAANDTILCVGETLTLTASSGASSPTYNWTGPNSTSSTNVLTIGAVTAADNGNYSITVTSANCTSPPKVVHVIVNALPNANATNTGGTYCSGNTISLQSSGGTGYSWTGPGGYTSSNQNNTILNATTAASGTYTVTVTDANSCVNTDTAKVIVNQTPGALSPTAASNPLCAGDSLKLLSTSTGGTVYAWNGPNSFSSSNQNPVISPASTLNAGTYTVTTSSIYGAQICTSTQATISVVVNPTPVAIASSNNSGVFCSGTNIVLNAGGGGTYAWSGPNSFSSVNAIDSVVNPTTAASGTYTVVVSNSFACRDTARVTVIVNQTPGNPNAVSLTNPICQGNTIQLSANSIGGTNYQWTGPNFYFSTTQNPTIPNADTTNSGIYTVTASATYGGNSCTSVNSTVLVTVNPNPTASAIYSGTGTYCSGDTVSLIASGLGSYTWSGPGSYTAIGATQVFNNIGVASAGTYTVNVVNQYNCSDTATVSIVVNQTPSAPNPTANANTLCEGATLQLNSSSTNAIGYNWSGPNGFTSATQNPTVTPAAPNQSGYYVVTALGTVCNSKADSVLITINANPVITAGSNASTYCSGDSILLNATGGGSYSWSGPGSYTSTLQAPIILNSPATAAGTYVVTVTNAANCSSSSNVTIAVNQTPSPAITVGDTTCSGAPLTLTANGTGTINWYSDATLSTLVQSNSNTYTPVIPANTSATYYVTVSNNGCTSTSSTAYAGNYNIHASAAADVYTGYVPLTVNFSNLSTGVTSADTYQWIFGDGNTASTFNASNIYNSGGTFNVIMAVTQTASGCKDTAKLELIINDGIVIIIPNVFSPNGDALNDLFTIDMKGVKEAEGVIYNRWGQILYSWNAIDSSWDGKASNGNSIPDGTYFYIIKIVGYNGEKQAHPGHVTIVR